MRSINLHHSVLFERRDGITEVHCIDMYYGKKECEEIVFAIGELSGGKRVPVLIVGSDFSSADKEGREYSATDEGTRHSIAEAHVIRTMSQKIIANFYIKINRPKVPTRFFKDKSEAEEWLKTFLK